MCYTPGAFGTQVSRAKWRPGHEHHIALAAGEQGMQVRSVVEPYVPIVVLDMGVHVKHGFCWVDTPLSSKALDQVNDIEFWMEFGRSTG